MNEPTSVPLEGRCNATDGWSVCTEDPGHPDDHYDTRTDHEWEREEDEPGHVVTCVCGYGPTTEEDLDEHILASMHVPGDHIARR